jgi:hypothetical protein
MFHFKTEKRKEEGKIKRKKENTISEESVSGNEKKKREREGRNELMN